MVVLVEVVEENYRNVVVLMVVEENNRKWCWWWWRKTIEFYDLQTYITAQHATIFSVYILLLMS